ncbi:UDP-glycosyltransferase 76B1-like [Malus domestica]|uniref:UDP-glycosyltransferase 76B1-like n=1 Tax=Malus domestica TaxID=3750 RepID=UPI0039766976
MDLATSGYRSSHRGGSHGGRGEGIMDLTVGGYRVNIFGSTILFPLPFPASHINPMLQLANILHTKGFSITIIHTNFNSHNFNPSAHPHFTFISIPDGLSESEAATNNILHLFSLLNVKCVEQFRECLASLLSADANSEEPIACLISDAIFHFTQPVAESLKLPRLALETMGATCTAVYYAFPLLRERGYLPIQDYRLEELVKELPPLKVKDLPVVKGCDADKYFEFIVYLLSITQASDGLIFNTFEDFEETPLAKIRHEYLPNTPIFPIGPFHKYSPSPSSNSLLSQDQSCISWLNTQAPKSVVYVSFGTVAKMEEAQFLEIAWGLCNSNQPFLWVVRPDLVHGLNCLEQLPSGFVETLNGRGHIVKWAPQKEVLAHLAVGAFWTHNGWNSTFESVCEGVPMICTPSFADQMVLARYASEVWKVGLQIEDGIERGVIEKAIRRVMVEKEGEEMRHRALKLMEKANLCLKQGGSSNQSLDGLVKHILSFKPFGVLQE